MARGALAIRYLPITITTPAGTAQAAPQTTPVDLGNVILLSIRLRIPSGHAGFTGVRVDYSGSTILPWSNPPTFLIGDDEALEFEVDHEVGRTLTVVTYNTDVYPHTHYLLAKITDLPTDIPAPLALLDITA